MKYLMRSGKSSEFMFSRNGTAWHANREPGDKFFRLRIEGFSWWSEAFELTPEAQRRKKIQKFIENLKNHD